VCPSQVDPSRVSFKHYSRLPCSYPPLIPFYHYQITLNIVNWINMKKKLRANKESSGVFLPTFCFRLYYLTLTSWRVFVESKTIHYFWISFIYFCSILMSSIQCFRLFFYDKFPRIKNILHSNEIYLYRILVKKKTRKIQWLMGTCIKKVIGERTKFIKLVECFICTHQIEITAKIYCLTLGKLGLMMAQFCEKLIKNRWP
jgi:hypothetical protein